VLELPVIGSGALEHRNVGHWGLNIFEVCSVRVEEFDSSLNCWQPHVIQDNVPFHGAQLCTQCELRHDNVKEMAPIHKDDVKAFVTVGKMSECSKGSLFNEAESFPSEALSMR
jgi:hypothetical protein